MSKRQSKTPLIYALEPRLLFDGDLGADVASAIVYRDGNAADAAPAVAPENQRETQRENISFEFHSTRSAIVFIDGGVEDPQTLADAAADVLPDDAQIHILDGDSDGFAQINDILENHDRVDEIHIFGHGTAGEARLGTASLSLETLTTHSGTLAVLKDTLTEDGDLLLYGCNIAAGEDGRTFIEELAELTAADIAASDDLTGAGGDWELEVATGPIETETIIVSEYFGRLSNGVTATTNVTEAHSATDLQSGTGHAGAGQGLQITQERTGIQTDANLNFNLGSNLTNNSALKLDSYLVYRNTASGNSGSARIVFDNGIAGINWTDWRSDASGQLDAQFAKVGASYDDVQGRGVESSDRQNVSFSGRALNITGTGLAGDTNGDYMRVFVYSSPATITAVDDAVSVTESVKVEAGSYQSAANIDLTTNDTTTTSSKRVVGLGNTSNNINDNPSHLDIGSLGLSAIAGVYGELRVASNNTISYWITDDGALESALANSASVTETFYYRVANEFGSEDDGEITITINRANDRPVANPYTITRTYDSSGFTIGTSSAGHPLVSGGITDADDSGPFVFSGIHADTSSNKTLANAVQTITIDNFGTVTVNGSDELVFTPHSDLANLPQGQSISRSFIYFVTDDGGAYNEGSNGVDLSDKITITINGTAQIETPQFRDQNQQVAKIYFQKNNKSTSSGNSLNNHRFNVLNDTRFAYSSNPSAHGQSNLQNGSLINDIWTISGAGNTLEFGGWTFADGTADTGNAYASEMQGVTSNTPHFSENSGSLEVGNSSYFYYDNTLGEGDTGTYTWYYRVNVVNNGNIISSDIGQLDIILEGINDVASTVRTGDPTLYDKTNSGQGDRITTAVTASKNLDISITDPDAGDTTTVQRIRLYARLAGSYPEKNEALDALEGSEFFLNRGESTDDSDWEHSDAWGVLSDHFVITFNSDGTLDYVSKRDAYRSSDGDFMVHVVSWTEHVGGVDSVQTNIDRTGSIEIRNIEYSANNVEFVDDAVAVTAVGSGTGSGSVAPNDNFFTSLESFKRSTGSYNVRVAAGQTIVGEYITLTMNANGSYSYTLNQKAFNALGNGETASESFTYWGHRNPNAGNEVGQATLTFNFTGQADAFVAVNDTARVVAGQTITGVSGDLGNQSSLSVYESSGTLTSNDINDAGNLTVVSFRTGREASGSGTNIPLNATNWIDTPNGEVRWNNNRYEFRADDVSSEVIEYFTYTVRNGDGEDDTAELAITIVPATDNEFVVEDLSHTMTDIGDEAGLTKTVTIANLLTHDANAIRSGNEAGASYAITGYAAGDSGSGFSNVGNTIRGTYGTLTINAAGVPTYVFDRPYSLQNAEKGYDVFTFEVTDGRGSPTTNTAQLTVQINGLNTTPSWSDDAAITITEDTGVTLTKYGDLATQGSNNATGYNTALTGGWANYLVDEFGDVDGHEFSKFDNASVERSSYNTTEGWTQWRQASGFQATTVGSATNQNSILIGSVPLGTNNTDDKITVDNTVPVGNSDVFNVSGELTNNIDIRGTFAVTVIGVQNTPVLTAVNDDVTADEKRYFSFGEYFYNKGSYGPDWGPGAFASVTGDASATADIFANDTNVPASMGNIQRVEVSSDGSNWTQVTRNNNNQPSVSNNSRIGGSDFYWRVNSNSSGGSYVEFAPSGFGALGPSDPKETGSFHYRIVELDGTTTTAVVSTQLTPVDDPPEVHRQGAVLDSSRTITVGASGQPNWNNNDGGGYAKPPSGVSNAYVMGNNGDNGDGVSIREVDMPGEHTGGLLDKSNSTLSADPDDNSVILSVTPRYKSGATASELSGLGNNSATSVTLRGNYGELTVNQDGSYSYNADLKRSLNWSYSNSSEDYDYVDSFNIRLGTAGVNGTGSVTTTLDIFFDGTDGAPTARDDTAHVKEDLNINVSGNAAASTSGGDDDSAVDAPGEHSGNLLANDTDANPNPNLQINAAGAGSSLSTLNLATNTDNPYRQITGTYGTLSIYKDGSYNYVANQDAADNLAAGQTANDVFGYRVIDNNNDTDTASLTITVHGTANETYDREVTTDENTPYSFVHTIENNAITATDFYADDADYSAYNPPIIITSLPHAGTLKLSGVNVVLTNGTKTISGNDLGDLSYVPPLNSHGDDFTFFTYEIQTDTNSDALSGITITMTIDIEPDANNGPPTAADNTVTIAEDTTHSFTAGQFNFSDVDSDSLNHIKITSLPATGTLKLNDSNVTQGQSIAAADIANLVYTPVANGNGDPYTTFQFKVNDGTADSASAYTMTVDVTPANDLPTAADNTVTIAEDATHSFTAGQFNFADIDGDSLSSIKITSLPATGALTLNGSAVSQNQTIAASQIANLVYTPVANGNGDPYTTFQFKVNDGTADSASAYTMTIDVTPANDLPTAADNTVTIAEGGTHSFTAGQFNFADVDGDSLNHIKITSLPATGTLKLNDSNVTQGQSIAAADIANLVYTPVANGNGDPYTTFQFKVNDGTADSASAYTMTIDVTPANDLPTAADNTVTIAEDATHSFTAGQFNFADIDGDSLSSIKITSLPATGALTLNGSAVSQNQSIAASQIANLVYTPVANGNGDPYTTFQFKVNDGTADSASAYTMTIDVTPANDLPTAADNTVTIAEGGTHSFTAGQFNFADVDGDSLNHIKITSLPATGTLKLNDSNVTQGQSIAAADIANLVYTPVANGNGDPYTTFQFKVNDGTADSASAYTMTIDVTPANDLPTAADNTVTIAEDTTHSFTAGQFNFADIDGDSLNHIKITSLPATGTLKLNDSNVTQGQSIAASQIANLVYTPVANGNGDPYTTFQFKVNDGTADSASAYTMTVDVTPANDLPTAADNTVTIAEDATHSFTAGKFNFADIDGDSLNHIKITSLPATGALTLNGSAVSQNQSIAASQIANLVYTPVANGNGDPYTTFQFKVNDGTADSASAYTMTIDVTPVNDPPTANPIVETRTKLDAQFSVNLVTDANATDIDDGDVLVAINDGDDSDDEPIATFTRTGTTRVMVTADSGLYLIDGAAVGSGGFALNPGRTYIFDWSGATGHPVRLSQTADGTHGNGVEYTNGVTVNADAGTTTIVVTDTTPATLYAYCENHAAMGFGTPVEAYDVPDSSYTLSGSTLTVNPQVFADLAANNEVEIAIAYKIADGDVADDATYVIDNTATITITGINTKPQIIDDKGTTDVTSDDVANVADVTTPEDTTYVFTLNDFNYVDQDNDPMASVLITQVPRLGELTRNDVVITDPVRISRADIEAGLLKYTPPLNDNGNAYTAFTYAVNDGRVDSDVGGMTIHVTPVNDPPTANPIVETRTKLDAQFSVNLVTDANATDIDDGDVLVAINDGDDSDDEPIATFTRTGTTRVMVTADSGLYLIDGAAVASGGFALNPGRTYIFDWSGATGHPVRLSQTADGTHGNGVEYTNGVTVNADAGTTTIVVTDATPATLYAYCENHAAMGFGTPVEAYDVPDSSYTLSGSTLTVNPQVFADLAANNEVEIAIAYKIADGDVADDATYVIDNTATIKITGINTKPQIIDDKGTTDVTSDDVANVADVTTPEDTTYVFTLNDFNYVDQDNDPMASVLITQVPRLGELTRNDVVITDPVRISRADIEAGLLKYTPPLNDNGNAYTAFTYAVNDGRVDSDVGGMTIHVTPVNDPPESADKFVRISGERTVQFKGSDFAFRDPDEGDALGHITLRTLPANGILYLVPANTILPAIVDPPMDPSWAISDISGEDGYDIAAGDLSQLIYVADETVETQKYDAFTFTVNDGSQITPGSMDSLKPNQINLGKVIFVQPIIEPEFKDPIKKEPVKPKEKRPELNPHDLPPVLKVAVNLDENRQLVNEPVLNTVGGTELGLIGDDNAGLADDSWMNAKTSMQPDISGNIRVIDLKVEGREIAVQITDEASDRAERFKGELADGSPLPSWVKVDQKTGLTTADPPPGAQPFEMRVVAEDGAGNARAIDLILDPTLIEGEPKTEPVNDKVANNAASDSTTDAIPANIENNLPRQPTGPTSGNNLSSATVDVLSDGRVVFGDTPAAANGSLKLMRMVNETDGIKIEINDDAKEGATRYEVRQKDGSAAPDWVQVDARTGELTIEAPQNIGSIELTIVALDGGEERRLDVDVDLEETRLRPLGDAQDAGQDDLDGADEQTGDDPTDELRSDGALPVSGFVPLDAQIDKALSENSYGRDIQQAVQSLS